MSNETLIERERPAHSATLPERKDGRVTHGMTNTKTYKVWYGMKRRCSDPSVSNYARYGGKGIRVCAAWDASFEAFLADMGECPEGRTLDRIDPAKGYEPENCRWATLSEQQAHTVRTKFLTFKGETKTLTEWAASISVKPKTIHERVRRGLPIEKILQPGLLT